MPKLYQLLFTAALLAATQAQAQQAWQPFRPKLTYQLTEAATPGDTTHTLRLGVGTLVPGTTDSLFRFTGRVGKLSGSAGNCYGQQRMRADNLFGATLRSQPRAVFVLAAANGRTLTLRPRAALGQPWATGLPGITASVTARAVAPVLSSAPDSVVTITLSDGETLRLSKTYGLFEGPSLDSYLNGRNRRRRLTLTALPERRLGTALTGPQAVYDYQPGDVFQYIQRSYNTGFGQQNLCQQYWWQDSVLTRQPSRTGDTLTYTIRTLQRSQGFGVLNAPAGFCSAPSTSTSYPASTKTVRVIASQQATATPAALTSSFRALTGSVGYGSLTSAASRNSTRVGGRPEYSLLMQSACATSSADSVVLGNIIDNYGLTRYAAGLGLTYSISGGIYSEDVTELTAFRKGTQTWGTFFNPRTLLATRPAHAAATTTAFPNPFGTGLTASFTLARTQAVAATLHDALGREVCRTAPVSTLAAGAQQLAVPTAMLPAGVYTLHLHFAGEDRTEVLKVVKAE